MADSGAGFTADPQALQAVASALRSMSSDTEPAVDAMVTALEALRGAVGNASANTQYEQQVLPALEITSAKLLDALTGWGELLDQTAETYRNGDSASIFD